MKKFYVFLIPLFALALLVGCSKQPAPPVTDTPTPPQAANSESASALPEVSPPSDPAGFDGTLLSGKFTVVLKTSQGDITLELDADAAPKTVTNFVLLSRTGYYDGLTFHRVIQDFMIQGGDPNGDGTGGESIFGSAFEDETDGNVIQLERGVIAMANRGPNTNGSQFFIVTRAEGTPWLQGKHTAFGHVIAGMDVLDAVSQVAVGELDRPVEPVTFTVEVGN